MQKETEILAEIQKYPDGIGLMDVIRPFLFEYSETGLRYTIRYLELQGKIKAIRILGHWMLFPIQNVAIEYDGVKATNLTPSHYPSQLARRSRNE